MKITIPSFKLAVYAKGDPGADKLALVLPGRLDTKDYANMKGHVGYLANCGYYALSFDPPGTWESSGTIEDYTMTNYLKAINELIEYFGNKPTLALGHSRGGSMAMLAGTTNRHITHFVSVMSRATASQPNKNIKSGQVQIELRDDPFEPDNDVEFKLPYSYFEDAEKYDMMPGLRICTKPKLFILGTRDTTVRPREDVEEAYEASADPKQLYKLDSGHDYRHYPELIEKVNQAITEFLKKYSQGDA